MIQKLKHSIRQFVADETASLTAETVIILPLLAWWYVGSLVFFNGYQARNVNLKAAYTISDMLSREDGTVNANYIEGLGEVFSYLTAGNGTNSWIRVTLVRCDDNCDRNNSDRELGLDWSYSTGPGAALVAANLTGYQDTIPLTPLGDRAILVETFIDYSPAFNVGLDVESFENKIVTRPRFVPVLCFDGVTCSAGS